MLLRPRNRLLHASCIVSTTIVTLLAASASTAAMPTGKRFATRGAASTLHLKPISLANREIEAFVRLDVPAVSELNAQSMVETGRFAAPDQQRSQAARVTAQQNAFRSSVQSVGARILSSQRVGANGFRIIAKPSQLASLRQMPGVRSVGRVELHELDNTDSIPWIGTPAVWSSIGKGKGVKIGVIDTGIDYTHAAFGGPGTVAAYSANDPSVVEPGSFPLQGNAVRGGVDLAGASYDAARPETAVRDDDPLDGEGHGTHVAATAAGRGVPGSVGVGVAPEAELYAIKVFSDGGGRTGLTSAGIEWAMDPNGDGDMSDHLDVINMSLGSAFGFADDPSSISSDNAANVGIVVVTSAGNAGAHSYVLGSPGASKNAIAVAATTTGGRIYARLTVTAPSTVANVYPSIEGDGPVTFKASGAISGAVVATVPADGCAPLTNDVGGKIVLIIRGTCGFLNKFQNAQAAGAKAVIAYNDGAQPDRQEPITMGGLDDTVTIPGLMISFANGLKLRNATSLMSTLDTARDPARDDAIAGFSSLGPTSGDSAFKPDLSAPGDAVVSAGVGTGTASSVMSGTSMSAPHVAGAAALLVQEHPDLAPADIKALLQNSTVDANASQDTHLTRQGVGVVRVDRASALTSFAKPAGVSFGRLNPLLPILHSEKIKVTNLTKRWRTYSVKQVPNHKVPGVSVICPRTLSVGPSGTVSAEIFLKFDPIASARQNVADDGAVSQNEVDGWCVLNDGKDQLRVGYIAVVDPASSIIVTSTPQKRKVTVRNLGPAVGLAEGFTLAKLGGESGSTEDSQSPIAAVGFRRADPSRFNGASVLEIGVVTEELYNHLSQLRFQMDIDTNKDGATDFVLIGTDMTEFDPTGTVDPGTFVTAQANAEGLGGQDFVVSTWDYNDRTFILPFTLDSSGGFIPEKFDYTLTLSDRNGNDDIQHGSVDLSKEIVPDLNSFSVGAGEKVDVHLSGGKGLTLWLLQNNPLFGQMGVTAIQ